MIGAALEYLQAEEPYSCASLEGSSPFDWSTRKIVLRKCFRIEFCATEFFEKYGLAEFYLNYL